MLVFVSLLLMITLIVQLDDSLQVPRLPPCLVTAATCSVVLFRDAAGTTDPSRQSFKLWTKLQPSEHRGGAQASSSVTALGQP